jgi:hypothetical protein
MLSFFGRTVTQLRQPIKRPRYLPTPLCTQSTLDLVLVALVSSRVPHPFRTLDQQPVKLIAEVGAFISHPIALISDPVAFISHPISLISEPFPIRILRLASHPSALPHIWPRRTCGRSENPHHRPPCPLPTGAVTRRSLALHRFFGLGRVRRQGPPACRRSRLRKLDPLLAPQRLDGSESRAPRGA